MTSGYDRFWDGSALPRVFRPATEDRPKVGTIDQTVAGEIAQART